MIGDVYNPKHIGNATYIKGVMGMKRGKNIFFPCSQQANLSNESDGLKY